VDELCDVRVEIYLLNEQIKQEEIRAERIIEPGFRDPFESGLLAELRRERKYLESKVELLERRMAATKL
jgi:hypothetical protein